MPTEEQEKIEELESKLKSANRESGDRRMEIKTLREDLENARGDAVRLEKQVFFAERVLDKINIPLKTREADLSGLGVTDDGTITGEVDFQIPTPAPPVPRASGETQSLTKEDIPGMSRAEIMARWDEVQALID